MPRITNITIKGEKKSYEFVVERDGSSWIATSDQGDEGGLATSSSSWEEFEEMLVDCVKTWEEE